MTVTTITGTIPYNPNWAVMVDRIKECIIAARQVPRAYGDIKLVRDKAPNWETIAAQIALCITAAGGTPDVSYPPNPRGVILALQDLITAIGAINYSDELAQDAVGNILTDTATIDLTYNNATPSITAAIVAGSITDTQINAGAAIAFSKLAAPAASFSMNSQKITNLQDGSNSTDAATWGQVQALQAGLDFKASVRVASTADVTISSAPSSIDGVTLTTGDRVLLKNQSTGSQNGIYVFNGAGSAMTRSTDADTSAEVTAGMWVLSTEGTTNADTGWLLTTNDPITLGTTALTFAQFPSGSLATPVSIANGGTGATTAANARTNLGLAIGTDVAAQSHAAASANVHGLPASVNVLGDRAAAGEFIQRGTETGTMSAQNTLTINTYRSIAVSFPVAFSTTPRVFVAASGGVGVICSVSNISTSGFTGFMWFDNTLGATAAINWVAIGT